MGQVAVTVNGRTYRLRCGDGEEQRLLSVAGHVREHVDRLTQEHGQIGDERLILMAAIMIADELFEVREQRGVPVEPPAPRPPQSAQTAIRPPLPQTHAPMPATVQPSRLGPQPAQSSPVQPQPAGMRPAMAGPAGPLVPKPLAAAASLPPTPSPPVNPPVAAAPVRAVEHLDATALMKGIEKKSGRP